MKRYRLLRDNKENGPFLQGELKSIGLFTTDLIWVEEESNCWRHPADIPELQSMIGDCPVRTTVSSTNKHSLASASPVLQADNPTVPKTAQTSTDEYFSVIKERIEFKAKPRKLNLAALTANLFGLVVLLMGVMLGAFVVKKIVDHFEFEPAIASANAVEVQSEALPVNVGQYAAKSVSPTTDLLNSAALTDRKDDSVKKQPVQVKTVEATPAVLTAAAGERIEAANESATIVSNTDLQSSEFVAEQSEVKIEETEPVETEKKAPSLGLSANSYKVGMFGGISDLEITVNNPSSTPVDKAVVQVEFLKPNGNVVKTQLLSVENISAGGTKKISVPSSSRGVTIRYKIVGVDG